MSCQSNNLSCRSHPPCKHTNSNKNPLTLLHHRRRIVVNYGPPPKKRVPLSEKSFLTPTTSSRRLTVNNKQAQYRPNNTQKKHAFCPQCVCICVCQSECVSHAQHTKGVACKHSAHGGACASTRCTKSCYQYCYAVTHCQIISCCYQYNKDWGGLPRGQHAPQKPCIFSLFCCDEVKQVGIQHAHNDNGHQMKCSHTPHGVSIVCNDSVYVQR